LLGLNSISILPKNCNAALPDSRQSGLQVGFFCKTVFHENRGKALIRFLNNFFSNSDKIQSSVFRIAIFRFYKTGETRTCILPVAKGGQNAPLGKEGNIYLVGFLNINSGCHL
jgi:hypothetical protein